MTRIGVCIACILALALGNAAAREQAMYEVLMETIESQRLIFHWRHEPERLATVLVYTCSTCEIQQKFIDRETRLIRGNQELDISLLGQRVEWDGHVTISSADPKRILKVEIFE